MKRDLAFSLYRIQLPSRPASERQVVQPSPTCQGSCHRGIGRREIIALRSSSELEVLSLAGGAANIGEPSYRSFSITSDESLLHIASGIVP